MSPLVYAFHAAFYLLFLLRRLSAKSGAGDGGGTAISAPHARGLIALHMVAFAVMYFGLGRTVLARRGAPILFAPHPVIGGAVIAAGGVLLASTLRVFESWRLLARIEPGHRLCTRGPFRFVRHPIYLAMDLLAVGTFLWVPSPIVLAGAALVAVAGDLRARGEERLLTEVFGDEYREYCRRTARAVPGLY